MTNDKPSVLEVVRARLKDGRSIADHDIYQLVEIIDNLQKIAFETNYGFQAAEIAHLDVQQFASEHVIRALEIKIEEQANEIAVMKSALIEHNNMLRSAFQAAQRDAIYDTAGTTNFRLLADRMSETLTRHHSIINLAKEPLK